MKRLCVTLLSALLAVYGGPAAAADGLYLDFGAGWSSPSDIKWHDSSASPTRGTIALKSGGAVDAEVGYRLSDGLRMGLEFVNAIYRVSTVSVNGTPYSANGQVTQSGMMGNVAYDIYSINRVNFTVGAGLGGGNVSPNFTDTQGSTKTKISQTNTAIAWQALLGINWAASDILNVQVDYRYRSTGNTRHTLDLVPACCATPISFDTMKTQTVRLGIRWNL